MNILVIGNGFDIEHGIPSSYKNFLDFIRAYRIVYKNRNSLSEYTKKKFKDELGKISIQYKESNIFLKEMKIVKSHASEFGEAINNNCWIWYFLEKNFRLEGKDNWIDIEAEILYIIQTLTNQYGMRFSETEGFNIKQKSENILSKLMERLTEETQETSIRNQKKSEIWGKIKYILLDDFSKLVRALEIYLDYCIDIKNVKKGEIFDGVKFDRLITFNYTNTYRNVYDSEICVDFIHGNVKVERNMAESNVVLGIEEFLSEDQKNKDIEFINYKKYYQRIVKHCDFSYREMLEKQDDAITTWFFGHSIGSSDKDILINLLPHSDFIYQANRISESHIQKSYICYYDKQALEQQVANLVQILGQDALNDLVCGANPKIKFVHQKDFRKELMSSIGSKKN